MHQFSIPMSDPRLENWQSVNADNAYLYVRSFVELCAYASGQDSCSKENMVIVHALTHQTRTLLSGRVASISDRLSASATPSFQRRGKICPSVRVASSSIPMRERQLDMQA